MTSDTKHKFMLKKKTLKAHSIIQMFLNIQMFGITKAKHLDSNEMFLDILLPISLYKHLKDSIKFFSDNPLYSQSNEGQKHFKCELFPAFKKCSVLLALT